MRTMENKISDIMANELSDAVHSTDQVSGFTHGFYNYPARFSPQFARAFIKNFTEPGDLIIDPFMGGATTMVEARTMGRRCIGIDINELSFFLAQAKTIIIFKSDLKEVYSWAESLMDKLNLHNPPIRATDWIELGYQRNINGKSTWPTRKTLELALANISDLKKTSQRRFARCVLLKTSQWALDCTTNIPTAKEIRKKFLKNIQEMSEGASDFSRAAKQADRLYPTQGSFRTLCLNRSVVGIEEESVFSNTLRPKLILTSPPYAGVHVLYHRWQIHGRRETPAPFWIANSMDGRGSAFYTMGSRKQQGNKRYFEDIYQSFRSLHKVSNQDTLLVQLVGFAKPDSQLPMYISTMEKAGFQEIKFPSMANMPDGRLWRSVPNRKWYATKKGATGSSKEVVLFHHLK